MINKTLINKNLFKNPFKEKSRKQIPLKENLLKDTSLTAQPSGKPLETGVETVTLCSMEPKKPGKISGLEQKIREFCRNLWQWEFCRECQ